MVPKDGEIERMIQPEGGLPREEEKEGKGLG